MGDVTNTNAGTLDTVQEQSTSKGINDPASDTNFSQNDICSDGQSEHYDSCSEFDQLEELNKKSTPIVEKIDQSNENHKTIPCLSLGEEEDNESDQQNEKHKNDLEELNEKSTLNVEKIDQSNDMGQEDNRTNKPNENKLEIDSSSQNIVDISKEGNKDETKASSTQIIGKLKEISVEKECETIKSIKPKVELNYVESVFHVKQSDNISKVFKAIETIRNPKNNKYLDLSAKKEDEPAETKSKSWHLTSERLLILDLLTMNYAERQNFLLNKAVENHLLTFQLQVSPEMMSVNSDTFPAIDSFKQKFANKMDPSILQAKSSVESQVKCEFCELPSHTCHVSKFLNNFKVEKPIKILSKPNSSNKKRLIEEVIREYFTEVRINAKRNKETEKQIEKLYSNHNTDEIHSEDSDDDNIEEKNHIFGGKITTNNTLIKLSERKRGSRSQKKDKRNRSLSETILNPYEESDSSFNELSFNRSRNNSEKCEDERFPMNVGKKIKKTKEKIVKIKEKFQTKTNENDLKKAADLTKKFQSAKEKVVAIKEQIKLKKKEISKDSEVVTISNMVIENDGPSTSEACYQNIVLKSENETKSKINKKKSSEKTNIETSKNHFLDNDCDVIKHNFPKTSSANESFTLNNTNLLIAQLLTLDRQQQDELIINLAKQQEILIKDRDSTCTINPKLHRLPFLDSKLERTFGSVPLGPPRPIFPYLVKGLLVDHGVRLSKCDPIPNVIDVPKNIPKLEIIATKLEHLEFGKIIKGKLRVNENDLETAYIKIPGEIDVRFDSIALRQCAMHDDIVKAFVFHKHLDTANLSKAQPRGFVIKIMNAINSRNVVGKIVDGILHPRTKRVPLIKIPKETLKKNQKINKDDYYLVKIEKILDTTQHIGKIVEHIGDGNQMSTFLKIILKQYDLQPNVYGQDILDTLPEESFEIPQIEYAKRDVLTRQCIFTIDPDTAKDLDDALSCRILDNGNYEIGVHISDVTYFLKEDSKLDNLVQKMTTSIYMVNSVFHMLPKPLCMLCSLLPGADKLGFSVVWELTPNAEIVSTKFAKTIINSCVQLSYDHAQKMIDCQEINADEFPEILNGFTLKDVQEIVNHLHRLAMQIRQRRFENGALRFDQPKLKFNLHPDTGEALSFQPYELTESNFLIEEFMLLANQSVARFCYDTFPDIAILRNHDKPDVKLMSEMRQKLDECGFKLNTTDSKSISESCAKIFEICENKEATKTVLHKMLAKPMVRAEYFCSGMVEDESAFNHFALAMPIYTHFTSPIRRYPDCLVHRVLSAALNLEPPSTKKPDVLQQITTICNVQKYNAKLAGDDCSNLYFVRYIKSIKSIQMRAAISDITDYMIQVVLILTGHRINIRIRDQPDLAYKQLDTPCTGEIYFVDKRETATKINIKLFTEIDVEVFVSNTDTLKAKILPPSEDQLK